MLVELFVARFAERIIIMSQYFINLDNKSQERYAEKIKNIDISMDTLLFPSITSFYIINYFLFALTKEELKAFKGLESYNQFVSGWVREVCVSRNLEKTFLFVEESDIRKN